MTSPNLSASNPAANLLAYQKVIERQLLLEKLTDEKSIDKNHIAKRAIEISEELGDDISPDEKYIRSLQNLTENEISEPEKAFPSFARDLFKEASKINVSDEISIIKKKCPDTFNHINENGVRHALQMVRLYESKHPPEKTLKDRLLDVSKSPKAISFAMMAGSIIATSGASIPVIVAGKVISHLTGPASDLGSRAWQIGGDALVSAGVVTETRREQIDNSLNRKIASVTESKAWPWAKMATMMASAVAIGGVGALYYELGPSVSEIQSILELGGEHVLDQETHLRDAITSILTESPGILEGVEASAIYDMTDEEITNLIAQSTESTNEIISRLQEISPDTAAKLGDSISTDALNLGEPSVPPSDSDPAPVLGSNGMEGESITKEDLSDFLNDKETLSSEAMLNLETIDPDLASQASDLIGNSSTEEALPAEAIKDTVIKVEPGDTLSELLWSQLKDDISLSKLYENVITEIANHNGISDPNLIQPGQEIVIPAEYLAELRGEEIAIEKQVNADNLHSGKGIPLKPECIQEPETTIQDKIAQQYSHLTNDEGTFTLGNTRHENDGPSMG